MAAVLPGAGPPPPRSCHPAGHLPRATPLLRKASCIWLCPVGRIPDALGSGGASRGARSRGRAGSIWSCAPGPPPDRRWRAPSQAGRGDGVSRGWRLCGREPGQARAPARILTGVAAAGVGHVSLQPGVDGRGVHPGVGIGGRLQAALEVVPGLRQHLDGRSRWPCRCLGGVARLQWRSHPSPRRNRVERAPPGGGDRRSRCGAGSRRWWTAVGVAGRGTRARGRLAREA